MVKKQIELFADKYTLRAVTRKPRFLASLENENYWLRWSQTPGGITHGKWFLVHPRPFLSLLYLSPVSLATGHCVRARGPL